MNRINKEVVTATAIWSSYQLNYNTDSFTCQQFSEKQKKWTMEIP